MSWGRGEKGKRGERETMETVDLEVELEAGFRKLLCGGGGDNGGVSVPSEQAIKEMCEREECRGMLAWLARSMQSEEVILAAEAEGGVSDEVSALADVLGTVSSDPESLEMDELQKEVEMLEAREAALEGPSGRIAQLMNRRERLAALVPTLAKDGSSMKGCERTTHQMCITACEDIAATCTELGHAVSDLGQISGSLAELHELEGKAASRTPPLLSQLSLENFIAQGDKHGEHVRRSLVLGRADEAEASELLFGGRPSSGLADEHEWYSNELERLRKVYAWGQEEHLNSNIALAQARSTKRSAEEQLARLEAGDVPAGSAAELEVEVMRLQQETIAAERDWEDSRKETSLPIISSLSLMHGVEALEQDVESSRARQEARMECQRRALHLLGLQSARLDVLELAMAEELASHKETAAVVSASEAELRDLIMGKEAMMRKVERLRERADGKGGSSPERAKVVDTDALLPLHVAVGGDEHGPSRAFLSAASLSAQASILGEELERAKAGLSAAEREHEGFSRLLEAQILAFEAILWSRANGGDPVCTPADLEQGLGRLDAVKQRLDEAIEEAVAEWERVQGGAGVRGRRLFVDFFLNPSNMASSLRKLKREAGVVS